MTEADTALINGEPLVEGTPLDLTAHPDHPDKTYEFTGDYRGLLAIFRASDGSTVELSPKKLERHVNNHLCVLDLPGATPDYINDDLEPLIEPAKDGDLTLTGGRNTATNH